MRRLHLAVPTALILAAAPALAAAGQVGVSETPSPVAVVPEAPAPAAALPERPNRPAAPVAAAPKPAPEEVLLSKDPQPTLTPDTAALTETAAKRYFDIVEAGGWPSVPASVKLAPGATGAAVIALKQRLAATGDLDAAALPGDIYDAAVEAAVEHFQDRDGLEQTGAVGAQTLKALNVTAIVRYNQLVASAARLRAAKFPFGPRYVVVNIPSANVETVDDGIVTRRYLAVVGKPDKPSPTEDTKIVSVNFNPTWTVPASIVKKEIIPHMEADPTYLRREHIRILDQAGAEIDPTSINWTNNSAAAYTLRQDSGAGNSLGTIRIDMPNRDAVYMHDTPSKGAFGANFRFLSHGCVRVSRVGDLAAWLLAGNSPADQPVWTAPLIEAAIAIGARLDVKLAKPVPVTWVYLTGYATPDHVVHFRNDVYSLDAGTEATGSIKPAAHAQRGMSAEAVAAQAILSRAGSR